MRKFIKILAGWPACWCWRRSALYAVAWFRSEQAMARTYVVAILPLTMQREPDTLARGAHIFATRGCGDCHGAAARASCCSTPARWRRWCRRTSPPAVA
jgi:mono/diheme cytochrome c family protein